MMNKPIITHMRLYSQVSFFSFYGFLSNPLLQRSIAFIASKTSLKGHNWRRVGIRTFVRLNRLFIKGFSTPCPSLLTVPRPTQESAYASSEAKMNKLRSLRNARRHLAIITRHTCLPAVYLKLMCYKVLLTHAGLNSVLSLKKEFYDKACFFVRTSNEV